MNRTLADLTLLDSSKKAYDRPSTRLILSVPFPQKDQAKALGARWDKDNKVWWVPSSVDPAPFRRWLQPSQEKRLLYEDLAAIDREELGECAARGQVEVVFVPWTCWKCHRTAVAFHGAVNRKRYVTHFLYQAQVIEKLESIRKELGLEPFGCIKPRFSRTRGQAYVSQGCNYCDALIGENPLWEDFIEVFNTVDMSTYAHCRALTWSLLTGA